MYTITTHPLMQIESNYHKIAITISCVWQIDTAQSSATVKGLMVQSAMNTSQEMLILTTCNMIVP